MQNDNQPTPQPTVVSPEAASAAPANPASQPVYPQPSVPSNGQTQLGLSASQMGYNQAESPKHWRSFLKPLIVAAVLVLVGCGGFLLFKSLGDYGPKTVQGDGFNYTVTYSKSASLVTMSGKTYLQGQDKSGQTMLLYVGKSVQSTYDCRANAGSTVSIIETPTIDGNPHNLCYSQTLNAYALNFTHNGVWYFLTVFPKDKSQALDQETVKMIADSVTVAVQ